MFAVQYTTDPLLADGGNSGHLYYTMQYENQPGMQRDIPYGRAFKRFRPTPWLLGLWDRTKDTRYDDGFQTMWLANNSATLPKRSSGFFFMSRCTIWTSSAGTSGQSSSIACGSLN